MIARITHNVNQVAQATTDAVRKVVQEGLTAVGLLAYLFYLNWRLSLIFGNYADYCVACALC